MRKLECFVPKQWAICTNWSRSKISAILDGKKAWHPPLGHREQRKVKLDRLEFLYVRIYYILLPSSMVHVNFVPCDQLVQKAHSIRKQFPRSGFKKRGVAEVFGNSMKHPFECLFSIFNSCIINDSGILFHNHTEERKMCFSYVSLSCLRGLSNTSSLLFFRPCSQQAFTWEGFRRPLGKPHNRNLLLDSW